MRSAGLPVLLTGSPIDSADCLSGSPITDTALAPPLQVVSLDLHLQAEQPGMALLLRVLSRCARAPQP